MKPPFLSPGDTIGVMAPASSVEKSDIEKSKAVIEEYGYKVFIHPQTYEQEHSSAGTILQKSLAFQGLWLREDIKLIWGAGGGNRSLHLLQSLNFKPLSKTPKIFIGFSDLTAILNAIYAHTGFPALHGPVFKNLHKYDKEQMDFLWGLLQGKTPSYPFGSSVVLKNITSSKTEDEAQEEQAQSIQGTLLGGNLSIFQYLPETLFNKTDLDQGVILFLEDCNEELSRIDRMFLHLKNTKFLDKVSALIIGEFSSLQDSGKPYGYTLEDIILEHCDDYDFPIISHPIFGHGKDLYCLPVGTMAELTIKKTNKDSAKNPDKKYQADLKLLNALTQK